MPLTTLNLYNNTLRLTNEVGDIHDVDLAKYIDVLPTDSVVAAALQNDGKTLVLTQPNTDAIIVDLESILDANNGGTVVNSVAGKVGAVSLVKSDVGLSNVDNTTDLDKPVSNPTKEYIGCAISNASGGEITQQMNAVSADNYARYNGLTTDMDAGFDPVVLHIPTPTNLTGVKPTHICAAHGIGVKKDPISGGSTMRITGNLEVLGNITGANGSSINYALCNACLCTTGSGTMYQVTDTLNAKCGIATSINVTADGKITSELVHTSFPTRSSTNICDITKKVSASTLCDISDYAAASVVDGTVLTWNATGKCWEPRPVESTQPAAVTWGAITGNIINQSDLTTCFSAICTVLSHKACFDSNFYNSGESESDNYIMVGSKTGVNSPIIRSSGIKACGDCFIYNCDVHAKAFVGTDLCVSGSLKVNGVTIDPDGFTETVTAMNYVPATKTLSYINEAGTTYSASLVGLTGATIEQVSYTTETGVLKFDMSDASVKTVVIDSGVSIQANVGAVCYDGSKLINYTPIVTTSLPFSSITGNYQDNFSIKNAMERKVGIFGTGTIAADYIPLIGECNTILTSDLKYNGISYTTSKDIISKNSGDHAIKSFEYDMDLNTITLCSNVCCKAISIPNATVTSASTTQAGTIEIATQEEVDAGLSPFLAVTPLTLAASRIHAYEPVTKVFSNVNVVNVVHNSGRIPTVSVYTTGGVQMFTSVIQLDLNRFMVEFSNYESGYIVYQ